MSNLKNLFITLVVGSIVLTSSTIAPTLSTEKDGGSTFTYAPSIGYVVAENLILP